MPLYEYRCCKCDQVFEVMQKFADAPLALHEQCGGQVQRLISAPGLQFKGSGWYITDYARSEGAKSKNGPTEKEAGDSKPTETKAAETKTETNSKSS